MLHYILILNKSSGLQIYSKYYGNQEFNEVLTSGFISAIYNFGKELFGGGLHDIELGPFRVLFESNRGDQIVIIALLDKSDSIINIRQRLVELNDFVHEKYGDHLEKDLVERKVFQDLDEYVRKILIEVKSKPINEATQQKFREIINKFRNNKEILEADLISITTGKPLYHEWKKDFLDLCLRQIDAFWKSTSYVLDQIILSYHERHVILYRIGNDLVVSALIRRNTPLGLATLLLEEVAQKIEKFR